ncbi:MAG: hypothetical protein P8X80_03380 [Desulfobacterales bacterium]
MDIAQILLNTLVRAAELSLLAIGLTMVFDILKFANFAHTDYAVLGALIAYVFNRVLGLNLVLAIILAAFVTGWVGILIDQTIFKRLRKIGAKPVTLMITSMGLAIALRNLNRLITCCCIGPLSAKRCAPYPTTVIWPMPVPLILKR